MRAVKHPPVSESLTPMREPSRWVISAPNSISNASIFRHGMLPLTGCRKISASVFRCLRFIGYDTTNWYRAQLLPRVMRPGGTINR